MIKLIYTYITRCSTSSGKGQGVKSLKASLELSEETMEDTVVWRLAFQHCLTGEKIGDDKACTRKANIT